MFTGSSIVATIVYVAINIFIFVMFARLILDLVSNYSRGWRPRGAVLVAAEVVYTITDPPIKFVRRFVPPLRIGGIQLEFSWSIVMLVAFVVSSISVRFII